MVPRRTKIIATLGPSTDGPDSLEKIIKAGVNIVRINLSHGLDAEHVRRVEEVRSVATKLKQEVGILLDLQGPKLRIAGFQHGKILLKNGQTFILDVSLGKLAGTEEQVGIEYQNLPKEVKKEDILLLNDGMIVLRVKQVIDSKIICEVKMGGELSNYKGINRKGGGLSAKALTAKDKQDIQLAAELQADYVAVSFPRNAEDMQEARQLLIEAGCQAGLIAKIERKEALESLDEIIKASEAVMVARGDLGVELDYAELPGIQKKIIARARMLDRAVITATQMMETMIYNPIPTRAEVSDVANAVLDGTDAVMLSGETAVGKYPESVVAVMSEVCMAAEKQRIGPLFNHRMEADFVRIDQAIAFATMSTANHIKAKAIVALTETGSTPLWMSRIRSGIPIYGLSRHPGARGRMTLYRGVYPVDFDVTHFSLMEVLEGAIEALKTQGFLEKNDRIILTKGDILGNVGGANTMKILEVQ